jgi:TolA-binding protein
MRAVQRKVFPDGAGKFLQPEVTAPVVDPLTGAPATSPVSDLDARVTAVEAQLRTLTGQVEQSGFRLRQLEQQFTQYKADMDARLAGGAAVTAGTAALPMAEPRPATPVPTADTKKPAAVLPVSADRKVAVAAIERPDTGNAADDAYTYGFRLWTAKIYPEAQVQLKATVEKYGATSLGSRAHNLLGRAYLDGGKPALASVAFYENYDKRPDGDRAADSLTYLGESLIQLKKLPDACKVYQELEQKYGATLKAELRASMASGRTRAKCGA